MKKIGIVIATICAISCIALADIIFANQFILVHDQVQPERIFEMSGAIKSGQVPPRIVSNLGYGFGYPLFNYYAPFPYYVGSAAALLGAPVILSTQLMVGLGFIAAGFSMYIAASRIWGTRGGLFASLLYLLAPYHAVQTYVRGSVGELYAYALWPLIILGIIELYKQQAHKKVIMIGMIAVALLAISHTISLYMFLYIFLVQSIIGGIVIYFTKKDLLAFIKKIALFILLPLLSTTFFWLPAFTELSFIQLSAQSGNDVNFEEHFIELSQLWSSSWGFGGSAPGVVNDGISFIVGKTILISAILSIILALNYNRKQKNWSYQRATVLLLGCAGVFSILHMLQSSKFVWEVMPYFRLVQFPWRFLTITVALCVLISPGGLILLDFIKQPRVQTIVYACLLGITIWYMLYPVSLKNFLKPKHFYANGYYKLNNNQITDTKHLRFEASKISDEYMPRSLVRPQSVEGISKDQIVCSGECTISQVEINATAYSFTAQTKANTVVYLDKVYFPDMKATVNSKETTVVKDIQNKIGTKVEAGKNRISFTIHDTGIRKLANSISLFTLIGISIYLALPVLKKTKI